MMDLTTTSSQVMTPRSTAPAAGAVHHRLAGGHRISRRLQEPPEEPLQTGRDQPPDHLRAGGFAGFVGGPSNRRRVRACWEVASRASQIPCGCRGSEPTSLLTMEFIGLGRVVSPWSVVVSLVSHEARHYTKRIVPCARPNTGADGRGNGSRPRLTENGARWTRNPQHTDLSAASAN